MIAGYITARTTDLAIVTVHRGQPKLVDHQVFANSEFSNFDSVFSLYLRKTNAQSDVACLGVAGPVIGNKVTTTNLPWSIDARDLTKKYAFRKVTIVNDLVAAARGLFLLKEEKFFTLNKGVRVADGNIGIIAAGTGLGEVLLFYDGKNYIPYASEGGHAGFSPGNQSEAELWEYIYAMKGYVEAEDVISLAGLQTIYDFILEMNGSVRASWYEKAKDKPGKLIEKALAGNDEMAVKALDLFVDCYAAETANLALKGMTLGGIYLGGLIAPQIITALEQGRFMEKFVRIGKMEDLLRRIHVEIIIDDNTALLGAAATAASSVAE